MAANRKKGKKSQSSNQGKSASKKPAIQTATSVSDNAIGGATTDSVSVDWEKGAPSLSAQDTSISSEGAQEEQTPEAEPQVDSEQSADNAGSSNSSADAELNDSSQSASVTAHSEVPTSPAETETPAEALDTSPQADFSPDTAEVVMQEPAAIAETTPSIEAPNTVSQDASNVKLTAPETPEAQTPAVNDPPKIDVNFGKDEIRTLLVPVSPFNRLIACIIVIFSSSILGYIILKTPAGLNAQGMHTIDLPEPGAYVFFFRGDTQDPYGWSEHGRFRESLEIDMEPVEPNQKVEKVVEKVSPIKDLSGANFFSVAEFEVNQPGKYNVWIKWNDPNAKCIGKIRYEKDPVETFFFKWALGIVGTIAFFYMVGIPMTTRKAQSTLPNSSPPALTK